MWFAVKRLFLGAVLIVLAAGTLLISDRHQRKAAADRTPHVAVFQLASAPAADASVQGIDDALSGWILGRKNYSPQSFQRLGRHGDSQRDC